MTVDLSSFNESLKIDAEVFIEVPKAYNLENSRAKVEIKGKLTKNYDGCILEAKAEATVDFNCDRCLGPAHKTISFDIYEIFSSSDTESEVWRLRDNKADITACIEANLFTHMPMKVYCVDECKGLCPVCGKNLNTGRCDCERSVSDPRFEALRSLFKDKEV